MSCRLGFFCRNWATTFAISNGCLRFIVKHHFLNAVGNKLMIVQSPSELAFPTSASTDTSPAPSPESLAPKRGRPRVLDDAKRHEISALVAGGCSLREAAKLVGCGINTINRELERNPQFSEKVLRSQRRAQLNPLRTMQRAARKHWRAAAWLLERAYPERFARRDAATAYARQAARLRNELILIVRREIAESFLQARLVKHVKAVFDSSIRDARNSQRTSGELRDAMEFFERGKHPKNAAPIRADHSACCSQET
jgi:helix-turn-helix protein